MAVSAKKQRIYNISGTVVDSSGQPIPNLEVEVWDRDLFTSEDLLTCGTTSECGYFVVHFDSKQFDDLGFDRDPDVYFKVLKNGDLLLSTQADTMYDLQQFDTRVTLHLQTALARTIQIGPIPL